MWVLEERSRRTEITQDMVVREYAKLAFADMADYVSWGPDGVRLKDSAELPDRAAAAVVEVSETTTAQSSVVRFRLHSKVAALDSLGKHLGIFREPSVQERNASVNIQRVEIHLDHGDRPPVVETHAIDVEALSPGDTEAEAYPPLAAEEQARRRGGTLGLGDDPSLCRRTVVWASRRQKESSISGKAWLRGL